MEEKKIVTRFDEIRIRVNEPQQMVGKILAEAVVRKYKEDFTDEDTNQVVTIDRNEVIIGAGVRLTKEHVAKIQFYQSEGSVKDVLVTNQDRPHRCNNGGRMFEVTIRADRTRRYLVYARGISMALAIAADYGEQFAGDDFYIAGAKKAEAMHVIPLSSNSDKEHSYHIVTIEYFDKLEEKNEKMTFLVLSEDADNAIDIVNAYIQMEERMEDYREHTIVSAKRSSIDEIVPISMSEVYVKNYNIESWVMDGMRVGQSSRD